MVVNLFGKMSDRRCGCPTLALSGPTGAERGKSAQDVEGSIRHSRARQQNKQRVVDKF